MPSVISRRTLIKTTLAASAVTPLAGTGWAQAWPSKPIRIVCGYPAGGLTDVLARAYGEYIAQQTGQPVVVENKAGASGSVAAQAVKSAPADGYTLMVTIATTMIANRVLFKSLPYDADKDFVLISSMSAGQLPFLASKETGATNIAEFVAYARKNKVSLGTYAAGSYSHIVVAELNKHFGLQMEAVHYRGEAPMYQDLAAGVIQGVNGSYAGASNVLQTGAGRAIAVSGSKRMSKLPDVATFVEQGVPSVGFQLKGFIGLVGPAGMPQDIVEKLSALMVEGGKSERVRAILDTFGIDEAAVGHVEFRKLVDEEKPIWLSLVESLGLTPQ